MAQLDKYLKACAESNSSDLHVAAGLPILVRRLNDLMPQGDKPITPAQSRELITEILTPDELQVFDEKWELDSIYQTSEGLRFRLNVCKEQHGMAQFFAIFLPRSGPWKSSACLRWWKNSAWPRRGSSS